MIHLLLVGVTSILIPTKHRDARSHFFRLHTYQQRRPQITLLSVFEHQLLSTLDLREALSVYRFTNEDGNGNNMEITYRFNKQLLEYHSIFSRSHEM